MAKRQESGLAALYRTQDPNSENAIVKVESTSSSANKNNINTVVSAANTISNGKLDFDQNKDYTAAIQDAVEKGNYSEAAKLEQQLNAKIDYLNATGTNQWNAQKQDSYSQYLDNSNSSASSGSPNYTAQTGYIRADGYDSTGMPEWVVLNNIAREASGRNTVNFNDGQYVDPNYVPGYSPYVDYTRSDLNPEFVARILQGSNYEDYVPANPSGSDQYITDPADREAAKGHGQAWILLDQLGKQAQANGNEELAKQIFAQRDSHHDAVEDIRAQYGYSGGEDGSQYIPLSGDTGGTKTPTSTGTGTLSQIIPPSSSGTGTSTGTGSGVVSGDTGGGYTSNSEYDLSQYLKELYAAQMEADLANLKSAYEKSMAGYDATAEKLPQAYDTARNSVAAQNALAKQYFNEYAAASGLSSGAAGQAALAQSSTYQRNISNLDQAQANALSEIDLNKSDLQREYENAIAEAKSTGNSELASALYQELLRTQGLERQDAQFAAQLELQKEMAEWERALAQQQLSMEKESLLWEQYMKEQQLALSQQELAMKYQELLGGYGSVGDTYSTYYPSQSTSTGTKSSGKGYDNGSLSADQIKTLQSYYGLTQDGMWGPNSQSTTGMNADEAWSLYQQGKMGEVTAAQNSMVNQTLLQSDLLAQLLSSSNQQSTIPSYMLAATYYPNSTSSVPVGNSNVAVAGSSYAEVLADVQDLKQQGESRWDISAFISNAFANGRITADEADRLQSTYGIHR